MVLLQEKIAARERAKQSSNEAKTNGNEVEEDPSIDLKEELIIPKKMLPFIHKEVNFEFYIELLTDKVDI